LARNPVKKGLDKTHKPKTHKDKKKEAKKTGLLIDYSGGKRWK